MSTRTLALAIVAALSLASTAAWAQQRIGMGETRGNFSRATPKAGDETPFVLYEYRGTPGERVLIEMKSGDFDAFLVAGEGAPDCEERCQRNDDGGGGNDSRLVARVPDNGRLRIAANAISETAVGRYSLTLSPAPAMAAAKQTPLAVPGSAQSSLGISTARTDDNLPYDTWIVRGEPNQRIVIDMVSADFDSMLSAHPGAPRATFEEVVKDDDGGSGNNSRLRLTLGADGMATVRATSYEEDANGSYTISTRAQPSAAAAPTARNIANGQSLRAKLSEADWYDDTTNTYGHLYRIEGRPGERILVQMESNDIDSLLKWGYMDGGTFRADVQDDDGGSGNNARLVITLDADGNGRLLATTAAEEQTGDYQLIVVKAPSAR